MIPIRTKFFDQKSFFLTSVVLLGFGRSSSFWLLSPLAAVIGYACAFGAMAFCSTHRRRFCTGWAIFSISILIQSSWFLSHPFLYIWVVWIALSLLFALPYAALSQLVVTDRRPTLVSTAGAAASFSLLEWGFSCLPCGYSFQSAALHLSWNIWPLQLASIFGAIGLSFFVYWANITVFSALFRKKSLLAAASLIIATLPYLVGGGLYWQKSEEQRAFNSKHTPPTVAFCHMEEPPDVYLRALSPEQLHEQEWQKILSMVSLVKPGEVDLIVFPEGAAPYSAASTLFHPSHLPKNWQTKLPFHHQPLSSLDLSEMLASTLQTSLLIGLEGRGLSKEGTYASYNSCFFVSPDKPWPERYDKQLLLPLGEYIPFESLRSFLSAYGIHDSFSPGTGAALFVRGPLRIAPLICYEETFSSYAREAWLLHPNLLVSLSNDCWYPSIRHEHLELARLRAVEVGIPLLRSCNQGVSAAIDALGRTIASRGDSKEAENSCVITPLSTYTAYSLFATLGSNVIASWLFLLWSVTFLYSRLSPESQEIEQPTLG